MSFMIAALHCSHMDPALQIMLTAGIPTLAVLIGILVNNSRLGDVNRRIDDLRARFDARLNALDTR